MKILKYLFIAPLCLFGSNTLAENIIFPAGANVKNVKTEFGAKGDGTTDDTAAIRTAVNNAKFLYFPNGTYVISSQIDFPKGNSNVPNRFIIQGQSKAGTIIKLANNAVGYNNPAVPKTIFRVSYKPAQAFHNHVRNLTLNTGSGNTGAHAIQFYGSNQSSIEDVLIKSGDGLGSIGLNLGGSDDNGPLLVKNVTVQGFNTGIYGKGGQSLTMENVTLSNQRTVGINMTGSQKTFIRKLASSQNLPITGFQSNGPTVILDSSFTAPSGAPNAIASTGGIMFVRNVQTSGYAKAIAKAGRDAIGPNISEWTSSNPTTLFPSATTSLNMSIKETPTVPWEENLSQWANVLDPVYGGPVQTNYKGRMLTNYGPALQRAIDSGKSTVYFPRASYPYQGNIYSPVVIRGNVKRLIMIDTPFPAAFISTEPITISNGTASTVIIERGDTQYSQLRFVQASNRNVVFRNIYVNSIHVLPDTGDVFLEDVCGSYITMEENTNVWARQFNPESSGSQHSMRNYGGNLWVFGLKTEGNAGKLYAEGGRNEIFSYILSNKSDDNASGLINMYDMVNSQFSLFVTEATIRSNPFPVTVRQKVGSETRTLPNTGTGGANIPLFIGHNGSGNLSISVNGATRSVGSASPYGVAGVQDGANGLSSSCTISGNSALISGNVWKSFNFSHTLTAKTVLEFTLNGSDTGEILGIALDSNNDPTSGRRAFRLGGTDINSTAHDAWGWKISPTYTANSASATYVIPVGTYFTGSVSHLGFIGDDDANGSTRATFSNIKIYEAP